MDIALCKAEEAIYKRDFTEEERQKLAGEGKALPDGSYPIETAADLHPAAVLARSGHGDVSAAKALIARRAKEMKAPDPLDEKVGMKKADFALAVDLIKGDIEGKVYGIVLAPDREDAHGDIPDAASIEKSCHSFMQEYALAKTEHDADIQHSGRPAGAALVENYIASQDLTIGGKPVTKGSWVQAWQVNDPLVKQEIIEGKLTGLSLEGTGVRTPVAA